MRYIFSGNLSLKAPEILMRDKDFKPVSLLCTWIEPGKVELYNEYKKTGFCDFIMVDSAAFSVYTGKADVDVDDYIEFINNHPDDADVYVELDSIAGKWGQPRSYEEYVKSAEDSWNTFLYMYDKVVCPDKILPVFHSGEPLSALSNMLEWTDPNGNHLDYIGLSAAKDDKNNRNRDTYFESCLSVIRKSSNPNVKVHLFGTTALNVLKWMPCYSCDSTTHLKLSSYGYMKSIKYGDVAISTKCGSTTPIGKRSASSSTNNFLSSASNEDIDTLCKELTPLNLTLEDVKESHIARCAVNMRNILKLLETEYKYNPKRSFTRKSLL